MIRIFISTLWVLFHLNFLINECFVWFQNSNFTSLRLSSSSNEISWIHSWHFLQIMPTDSSISSIFWMIQWVIYLFLPHLLKQLLLTHQYQSIFQRNLSKELRILSLQSIAYKQYDFFLSCGIRKLFQEHQWWCWREEYCH